MTVKAKKGQDEILVQGKGRFIWGRFAALALLLLALFLPTGALASDLTRVDIGDITGWTIYDHSDTMFYADKNAWLKDFPTSVWKNRPYFEQKDPYASSSAMPFDTWWKDKTVQNALYHFDKHITAYQTGSRNAVQMVGYSKVPYVDWLFYSPSTKQDILANFCMDSSKTNAHTLDAVGFMFQTRIDPRTNVLSGYVALYRYVVDGGSNFPYQLSIYRWNDGVSADAIHHSLSQTHDIDDYMTLIASAKLSNWKELIDVQIEVRQDSVSIYHRNTLTDEDWTPQIFKTVSGASVTQVPLTALSDANCGFGFISVYTKHACAQVTSFTFTDLIMAEGNLSAQGPVHLEDELDRDIMYKPGPFGKGKDITVHSKDKLVTLLGTSYTCADEDILQIGWSELEDATTPTYQLGQSNVYVNYKGITLYPVWEPNVRIRYSPGSDGVGAPQECLTAKGGSITLLDSIYTREGYRQTGWSISENSSGITYSLKQFINNLSDSMTLYPVWKQHVFILTYAPGDFATGSTYQERIDEDIYFQLKGATYTRSYCTQDGWSTDPSGATLDYSLSRSNVTIRKDTTLYPHWKEPASVRCLPGEYGVGESRKIFATNNQVYLPGAIFERSGYVQVGWSKSENSTPSDFDLSQFKLDKSIPISASMDLYPIWVRISTLTYAPGNYSTGSTQKKTMRHDTKYTLLDKTYFRDYFVQDGWSTDPEGKTKNYSLRQEKFFIMQDTILYPHWAIELAVYYYPGEYGVGDFKKIFASESGTTTISGQKFTRPGFVQIGWSTKENSEEVEYAFYANGVIIKSPLFLYPVWKDSIKFTYAPGSYATGDSVTLDLDENTRFTMLGATYTRENFTQTGWSLDEKGGTLNYELYSSATAPASNVTVYPFWLPKSGVLYLPGANGKGEPVYDFATSYDKITLRGAIFKRDGYVQTGWTRNESASNDIYALNDSIYFYQSLVFYPHWEKEYTLTYAPGDFGTGESMSFIYSNNTYVSLLGETYKRAHYVQNGWKTDPNGTRIEYALDSKFQITKDITLYPNWKLIPGVHYLPGADGTGSPVTDLAEAYSSVNLRGEMFTRENYIQIGWNPIENSTDVRYELEQKAVDISNALILYPVWAKSMVQVNYLPGELGTGDPVQLSFKRGTVVKLREALFTREGYLQTGWTTSEGHYLDYSLEQENVHVLSDLTLYPAWTQAVTLTYAPGDFAQGNEVSLSFARGSYVKLADALFHQDGYVQVGWINGYHDYALNYESFCIAQSLTLYPKWKKIVQITYAPGAYAEGQTVTQTATADILTTLREALFTRENCTQTGWSTTPTGDEKNYELSYQDFSCSADTTLYPYWTKNVGVFYEPGVNCEGQAAKFQPAQADALLTLFDALYTREGYVQVGWSRTDNNSYSDYALRQSNLRVNAAWTLYPVFAKTCSLTYARGDYGTGDPVVQTVQYGSYAVLRAALFTRENYTQTGWSTTPNGNRMDYWLSSNSAFCCYEDTTLYPYWTKNLGVFYEPDTYCQGQAPQFQPAKQSERITLFDSLYTREGYVQIGWATSGGYRRYALKAENFYVSEAVTLYPTWARLYTLTYAPGTYGQGAPVTQSVRQDTYNTLREALFERENCIQGGWTTDPNGGYLQYPLSDASFRCNGDATLYPYWTKNLGVFYEPGKYGEGPSVFQSVQENELVTLREALYTRQGFVQIGWTLSDNYYDTDFKLNQEGLHLTCALTLYPQWAKIGTLTYAPGTYGTGEQVTQSVTLGTDAVLKGALFTREGYAQTAWSTVPSGDRLSYPLSETSFYCDQDTTLYPYWTKNLGVYYEPGEEGDGEPVFQPAQKYEAVTLREGFYTRAGYIQTAWTTSNGYQYELKQSNVQLNAALTLYPVWAQALTLTYAPGEFGVGSVITEAFPSNTYYPLRDKTFEREYAVQTGWSLNEDGSTSDFPLSHRYFNATENVTLYPYWKMLNGVTYLPGEFGIGEKVVEVYDRVDYYDLSNAIFARSGYSQIGWSTVDNATEAEYTLQQRVLLNTMLTLYPVWKSTSGIQIVVTPAEISVKKTKTQAFKATVTGTKKTGVVWSVSGGTNSSISTSGVLSVGFKETATQLTVTATSVQDPYCFGRAIVTVTAAPKICTVTFDSDGGSEVSSISGIESGTTITLPKPPVKENYVFSGWFSEKQGLGDQLLNSTLITESITVYAKWTEKPVVKYGDQKIIVDPDSVIKVNPNGGSWTFGGVTYTKTTSITVKESMTLPDPTRDNFCFDGWTKGTASGCVATFTAKWTEKPIVKYGDKEIPVDPNVKIKVDPNGGSWTFNGETYTEATKVIVTKSITLPDPTRENWEFAGWTKGEEADYAATFTAKWTEKPVVKYDNKEIIVDTDSKIKVDPNGGSWTFNNKTYTAVTDVTVSVSITLPAPTRENFIFDGWTKGECSGYAATFTAKWTEKPIVKYGDKEIPVDPNVKIKVDPNGGSWTFNGETYTKATEVIVAKSITLPDPTCEQYDFAGWTKDEEADYAATFTAKWTKKPVVKYDNKEIIVDTDSKIKVDPNGGSWTFDNKTYTAVTDVTVSVSITLPDPTREQYDFTGWEKGELSGYAATFTANWKKATGSIDGKITNQDDKPEPDVTVEAWHGNEKVGRTVTDKDGRFSLSNLPMGYYSLKGIKDPQTITRLLEVNSKQQNGDMVLPNGVKNTYVTTAKDTPAIAAEGLNGLFLPDHVVDEANHGVTADDNDVVKHGGRVDIELKGTLQKLSESEQTIQALEAAFEQPSEALLLIDLSITKKVTPLDGTSQTTKLIQLPECIDIVVDLPESLWNTELKLARLHEGVAQLLTTDQTNEEYYRVEAPYLFLHVCRFSDYALMRLRSLPLTTSPVADQNALVGGQATFTVEASGGSAPYTYQWQINRGYGFDDLRGATQAQYTTSAVKKSNNGYLYRCVVRDAAGNEAITNRARLSVTALPPQTGDSSAPTLWLALLIAALMGGAWILYSNKRKNKRK